MSWLSVEIDDFVDAAKIMCDEIGDPVRIANARLGVALADCGSMAGDDDGGRGWAAAYDPAAHSVLTATNQVAAAAFQTASMFGRSATNYAAAEHSSTAGQAASSGTPLARRLPAEGILGPPRTPPSAAGGGGDAPAGWALIKDLVGYVWPNGHQDRLRRAAAAYRHCASALESVAIQPACASVTFIRGRLPEADDINTVCGGIADRIRSLIGAHQTLARSCDDLADHIDHCHAKVESELQELALESVAIQTVGAVLSFFSFGAAEVPAQAVQAGRIAAVAGKVAEIIRRFVTAAKALDAAIPTVTETAQAVGRALDKLANARLAYAGVTDVRRIDRVAMAARGREVAATTRLSRARVSLQRPGHLPHIEDPKRFDPDTLKGLNPAEICNRIPRNWTRTRAKNGEGISYSDPNNRGRGIRIMRGYPPHSRPDPRTWGPYAVMTQNGSKLKIPLEGNPTL